MSRKFKNPTEDPLWLKLFLGTVALGFIAILLLLPLTLVFKEAFADGVEERCHCRAAEHRVRHCGGLVHRQV
jgi:ABC-type sulfate transport system permease subunit